MHGLTDCGFKSLVPVVEYSTHTHTQLTGSDSLEGKAAGSSVHAGVTPATALSLAGVRLEWPPGDGNGMFTLNEHATLPPRWKQVCVCMCVKDYVCVFVCV